MKPIYAMHKDANGRVLNAASFGYNFELSKWLNALDVRAGDRVEFEEVAVREDDTPAPALSVAA